MKVLIIGSGGREHTLAWKVSQNSKVEKIYAIPGNPGIALLADCINLDINNNQEIVKFALDNKIDLTIVGPEVPLTNGLVDELAEVGLKAFGPTKVAAEIEGSKAFSKWLMKKYDIPTARFEVFEEAELAKKYVNELYNIDCKLSTKQFENAS